MCLRKQEHQKTVCVLGLEEDWQFAQAVIVNVVEPEQISFVSILLSVCRKPRQRAKLMFWQRNKALKNSCGNCSHWLDFIRRPLHAASSSCIPSIVWCLPVCLFSLLLRSLQHWPRSWTPAGNSCWRKRKRYLSSKPRGTTPGWGQHPYTSLLNFPYLTYFNMTIGIQ